MSLSVCPIVRSFEKAPGSFSGPHHVIPDTVVVLLLFTLLPQWRTHASIHYGELRTIFCFASFAVRPMCRGNLYALETEERLLALNSQEITN